MSENVELPAPTTEDVEAHRFMQVYDATGQEEGDVEAHRFMQIYDTTGEQGDEQASGAQ